MEMLSLWLCIIFFCLQHQTGIPLRNNSINHLCRQEERQLLLQLKQQLPLDGFYEIFSRCEDPKNTTTSWNQATDCCLWDGVTCDESTGNVIGLDLGCSNLSGEIQSNSSLFRLTHLRKLNLSSNNFLGSEISFKFGLFNSLTHLDLSSSGFSGEIPVEFYHLSNLVSLDISSFPYDRSARINCDIKILFGNMTKIRVLRLVLVNISSEMPTNMSSFLTILDLGDTGIYGELPWSIFEKPSLEILRLDVNQGLKGSFPKSLNRSNVQSLQELDLSWSSMTGRLPESIDSMSNLVYMTLGGCKFWGPIPESIGNMTAITYIDMSSNELSGQVPSTISSLQQLTVLDLGYNNLEGQLPDAISDLQKLTSLDLDGNYLVGQIPSSLTNLSQLVALSISWNALTGPLPSRAGDGLQNLTKVDLSNNSIHGMIPSWLLSLPSLEGLDLSHNSLSGKIGRFNSISLHDLDLSNNQLKIELQSFFNLSNIASLVISYNTVIDHTPETINVTLPPLDNLDLSSCEEFPKFLRYVPSVHYLDISNNKIHGPIPSWFTHIPWQFLGHLNLSANYFTDMGNQPWQHLQSLGTLDLHSNSLRGIFPSSVCNLSQLSILNLSNNKLRGEIPECISNSSFTLGLVDLRMNQFHGKIRTAFGKTADDQLFYLGLNGNYLEGPVPRSLANCTGLESLDLGNNIIYDTFPWWLQTLTQLKILILKSNRFHGPVIPPASNHSFADLHIIDLSYNNFSGVLPEKFFAGLHAMKTPVHSTTHDLYLGVQYPYQYLYQYQYQYPYQYQYSVTLSVKGEDVEFTKVLKIFTTIDLSSNSFHGHIPESIAYLNSLRLLNLSHNGINGSIPQALAHLRSIEQLDLSSNQLTGRIPPTLTKLTFLSVLNLSYNHLVGPIPQANQFPTFSNDSYLGNPGLCGAPLTEDCGDDKVISSPEAFQDEDESVFMMGFTWKAVMMGYGCGVVFGFIYGYMMISVGKPKWLARFFYTEAANCLNRRKKGHGRR